MNISEFRTRIGEDNYLVGTFQFGQPADKPTKSRTHHVWILDRSHSLSGHIQQLMDQVKTAARFIPEGDLLSLLYFAGPGVHQAVLLGATVSKDIDRILDDMKFTLGTTCFSEVMRDASDVIARFDSLTDQTEITIFTDGEAVVPWYSDEEESRTLKALQNIKKAYKLAAVNAIGYGNYYNRNFLNKLVRVADQGRFVHATSIEKFVLALEENITASTGMTRRRLVIEAGPGTTVMYLGDDGAQVQSEWVEINNASTGRNTFYVIYRDGNVSTVRVSDGDQHQQVMIEGRSKHQKTPTNLQEDFHYALAAELYVDGLRQKALDALAVVADKPLLDALINSFSAEEAAIAQNLLNAAARGKERAPGSAPKNYIPDPDAFCFMDLMAKLGPMESDVLYVPFSKHVGGYQRIGRKVTDTANAFKRDDYEVTVPFSDFVWNKERLNLSILFPVKGKVDLNPNAAKRLGLENPYPASIFRTHTFVKDGSLNIKKAEFLIATDTYFDDPDFADLVGQGIIEESKGRTLIGNREYTRVVMNFDGLPIINRRYIDGSADISRVHGLVVKQLKEEAALKVVNHLIKQVEESSVVHQKTGIFEKMNKDQIALLTDSGISDKGVYGGISNEKPSAENSDTYTARRMAFAVKGSSSLPSVDDMFAMRDGKKKMNFAGELMSKAYDLLELAAGQNKVSLPEYPVNPKEKFSKKLAEFLKDQRKYHKDGLYTIRHCLNEVKLAKVLTNDFFPGLTKNDKGQYTYEENGITVVLTMDYVTEYI